MWTIFQGYMDKTLDDKTARYKKGAAVKWIGLLISLVSSISYAGTLQK